MQSLSTSFQPSAGSDISVHPSSARVTSGAYNSDRGPSQHHSIRKGSSGRAGGNALQDDYRQDSTPPESRSLADYIRFPSSPTLASASNTMNEEEALQAQMESEFPKLDSALIAAIVADHTDRAEAKHILSALSCD